MSHSVFPASEFMHQALFQYTTMIEIRTSYTSIAASIRAFNTSTKMQLSVDLSIDSALS